MDKKTELKRIRDALNGISQQEGIDGFGMSSQNNETKMAYHLQDGGAKVFIKITAEIRFVIDEKKPKAQDQAQEPKKKLKKKEA